MLLRLFPCLRHLDGIYPYQCVNVTFQDMTRSVRAKSTYHDLGRGAYGSVFEPPVPTHPSRDMAPFGGFIVFVGVTG